MFLATAMLLGSLSRAQSLDLSHDFVISGSERLAMGGAGMAFARGVSGSALVPGVQSRRRAGRFRPALMDATARLGSLGWRGSDIANLDGPTFHGHIANLGFGALLGRVGLTALATGTRTGPMDDEAREMDDGELHGAVSLTGPRGHVHLGLGALVATGEVRRPDARAGWLAATPTAGLFVELPGEGMQFAVSARPPAVDRNMDGAPGVDKAVMPAQGAVGVAWASVVGPTPLRRHPTRLAADLVVTGRVEDGVSPDAWLLEDERPRGRSVTVEPRVGGEIELWPGRLRVRAGSYLEPGRTAGAQARLHGTAGLELKVIDVTAFGARWPVAWRCAADVADEYAQIQLLGIDFWRASFRPDEPATR